MRTKLVFALIAVALASMLAFGAIAYGSAATLMRERALERVDGIAETKREGLERIAAGWEDHVRLISSRTQLRLSLLEYNRRGGRDLTNRIARILADAVGSSVTVRGLAVQGADGSIVASAGVPVPAPRLEALDGELRRAGPVYLGISGFDEGEPLARFATVLTVEGARVGVLYAFISLDELGEMTANLNGLGETGETLIAVRDEGGEARLLHPTRHGEGASIEPLALERPGSPVARALAGEEGRFWRDTRDYRGRDVWAATRFLPDRGWGVVVKFDATEQRAPIAAFRRDLVRLGVSLAAFAILFGTLLGLRFGKPIHDLAEVANRIRDGELEARAPVAREDEIGLFARTFNEMTDELENRMTLLNEFKAFFDYSVDLLCIAGTDGYFKRLNPAFERTLGWTEEQLLERPFFDFIHPDDVAKTVAEVDKLSQGIPTISFENRFRCADDTYKHLLWTAHPEPDGTLYSVARDITELKRLRQRPRAKP